MKRIITLAIAFIALLAAVLGFTSFGVANDQVTTGDPAPEFELADQNGQLHSLEDIGTSGLSSISTRKTKHQDARPRPASSVTIFSHTGILTRRFWASAWMMRSHTRHLPKTTACRFRCSPMSMAMRRRLTA